MNGKWIVLMSASAAALSGCAGTRSDIQATEEKMTSNDLPTYVYFIHPNREGFIESPTEDETKLVEAHFMRLKELTECGVVLLAGPSTDPPYTGIVVFHAKDRAEAQTVMEEDPAVAGGVFEARLSAFHLSLAAWK